jgi:hypothetical protein
MKFRTVFSIAMAIIFAFSLMTAQSKDKAVKKTSDKKSECSMSSMKSGSKDCCKKDGKMSEKCSTTDKAKCDMSKGDKSKCPGMKSLENKTGTEKK